MSLLARCSLASGLLLLFLACTSGEDDPAVPARTDLGKACKNGSECLTGLCIPRIGETVDQATFGVCTKACSTTTDCTAGWECLATSSGTDLCQCKKRDPLVNALDGVDNDCDGVIDMSAECKKDRCFEKCVDFKRDPENCGGCLARCNGGTCQDGACICPPDRASCNRGTIGIECVDLKTATDSCGECFKACAQNEVCIDAACECGTKQCTLTTPPPYGTLVDVLSGSKYVFVLLYDRLALRNPTRSYSIRFVPKTRSKDKPGAVDLEFQGTAAMAIDGDDLVYTRNQDSPGIVGCVGAGVGGASTCTVVLDTEVPTVFTVKSGIAYWAATDGSLKSCPLTGCPSGPTTIAPKPIAAGASEAREIAVDASGVYAGYGNVLVRAPLTGGSADLVGDLGELIGDMQLDASSAHVVTPTGIVTCAKTGCAGGPTRFVNDTAPGRLRVEPTEMVWSRGTSVFSCLRTSGTCAQATPRILNADRFDLDSERFYVLTPKELYSLGRVTP